MTDNEALAREIARIRKNARQEIVISLGTFKTYKLLHLRLFARNEAGNPIPTKSGFAVQIAQVRSLRDALVQAEREACALGWLSDGDG